MSSEERKVAAQSVQPWNQFSLLSRPFFSFPMILQHWYIYTHADDSPNGLPRFQPLAQCLLILFDVADTARELNRFYARHDHRSEA